MKWSHVAVLAPSFYMSRVLGLTPLLARRNKDGTLKFVIHWTLLIISLLNSISLAYITAHMSINRLPMVIKHKPLRAPYALCLVLASCGCIVFLGTAVFYRQQTVRAFNEVLELSRTLMGHLDRNRLPYEFFFCPITCIFVTIRYIQQVCNFTNSVLQFSCYLHSYLIYLSLEGLVTGFFFYLENFFKCLNTELSGISFNLNSSPTKIETRLILSRLKYLRTMHNRICDLCDLVCERFSLDLFIMIGLVVFLLLSVLYADIWTESIDYSWFLSALNVSHYGFLILRLVHICYLSDCVVNQSEVTSAKVHSLMTAYLPAEIKQEIYHFTLQTMLRKVEITASGFYGLRMETITTLLYLISTYLVMVINLTGVI